MIKTCLYFLIAVALSLAIGSHAQAISLDFGKLKETATKLKRARGKVSVEEEVKIGDSVAAQLLGAGPLVANPELQRYVNQVGMWVAQHSERKNLPWTFGVIDSGNINAFATPGGRVLITKGLFLLLENEAELAGILGHEIAHVVAKHHLDALKKNSRLDLLGDVLQTAANEKKQRNQQKLNVLINAGTQLYARGLDRHDEYEADRLGVVYAARAGYDAFALQSVLATLDSIHADSEKIALLTKTHPSFSDRLNNLDLAMGVRLDKYGRQSQLAGRLFVVQKLLVQQSQ